MDELKISFSLSHRLPLRRKGRPGYRCNLQLVYIGLCEPRVAKSLVDLLYTSHLPKEMPHVNFSVARVVSLTLLRQFHFPIVSPCVIRWMDGVASLSPHRHVSFPEWVMSLRCPHSGPYIYIGAVSLLPLTSLKIPFLPTRPRSSSSFLPSFQVFPLPS